MCQAASVVYWHLTILGPARSRVQPPLAAILSVFGRIYKLNTDFTIYKLITLRGPMAMLYFGKGVVGGSTPTNPSLQSTC